MTRTSKVIGGLSLLLLVSLARYAYSQTQLAAKVIGFKAQDPGVRSGPGAGDPIPGLTQDQTDLFNEGKSRFQEQDGVTDGLGPRMNLNSCSGCHAAPAIGGSGPAANPQFQFVTGSDHGVNALPNFITSDGPTREVRFKKTKQGTPDGGVHDIFVIAGMKGVPNTCKITQPDFAGNKNNIIFRIPTPVFGAGLMEQIRDADIVANLATEAPAKRNMQIRGKLNVVVSGNTHTQQLRTPGEVSPNGNDGTLARFGWKAQNKSLLIFAGEAYNVEMGISNELFQTEREESCVLATPVKTPNDGTNPPDPNKKFAVLSDIETFAAFMRYLAPPTPSTTEPGGADSIKKGKTLFSTVGCALCHTPSLPTDPNSRVAALAGKQANLYSDLALHQMGQNLEDGVSQGQAEGNEFRTAPLWGLGQRIFFLHDGRTKDLVAAIQEHRGSGSEANGVIRQYDRLSEHDKQDLLNFLRSL